jgi:hypothetical protein
MQTTAPIPPRGVDQLPNSTVFIDVKNGVNMAQLHVVMGVHTGLTDVKADDDSENNPRPSSVIVISDSEDDSKTESTSDNLSDEDIIPETQVEEEDTDVS